MRRLASALAVIPAAWLGLALVMPTAESAAAMDTADASIPVDAITTLEMHSTANCVKAEANCYFTTAANLRTPEGPIGFPDDLWARQTTTVRTMDKTVFLESDFDAPNTRMFKSIGPIEIHHDLLRRRTGGEVPAPRKQPTRGLGHRSTKDGQGLHRLRTHPGGVFRGEPHLAGRLRADHIQLKS